MRSLRSVGLVATMLLAWSPGQTLAGPDAGLTGSWSRIDGETRINITPCGERLCAVNTWVKDPSKGERVGDQIVMNVQPREPATLTGEAHDVRRGLTYSLQISVGQDAMRTKGCLVSGLVCRTLSWVRVR
jgi:uncharacterized protein (DUF2147 family)